MNFLIKTFYFTFIYIKLQIVLVHLSDIATIEECSILNADGRLTCVNTSTNQPITSAEHCRSAGCCWDEKSNIKCYDVTKCRIGFYGWRCHLNCTCLKSGSCDRTTGICHTSCPDGFWGTGCSLDNNCSYNDEEDLTYTGFRKTADNNQTCLPWSRFNNPSIIFFYDYELHSRINHRNLSNFCRNPNAPALRNSQGAWCYVKRRNKLKENEVRSCNLGSCECPIGTFGSSCMYQCHCKDVHERCDASTGACHISGCHERWMDRVCSECTQGYFGPYCEHKCRCRHTSEVCDKFLGQCESGCASGWYGPSCQNECEDGLFGVNCENSCNCRAVGEVCNKSTGYCPSGCNQGYGGEGCLLYLPRLVRAPASLLRNATSIHLHWRAWNQPGQGTGQGPITGYQVFYRESGKGDWIMASGVINDLFFILTNLTMDTMYDVQVTTVRSDVMGLPSPILRAETCGYPTGPVNITNHKIYNIKQHDNKPTSNINNINGNNIMKLQWMPPYSGSIRCLKVSHYKIYILNSSSPSLPSPPFSNTSSTSLPPSTFWYTTITRLTRVEIPNINIYSNMTIFVTFVNNAALESPFSSVNITGKSQLVDTLEVFNKTSTSLFITWTPPKISNGPIESYVISYRPTKAGGCQNDITTQNWITTEPVNGSDNKIEILDLMVFATYQIKVWPVTFLGQGQEKVIIGETDPIEPIVPVIMKMKKPKSMMVSIMLDSIDCQNWNGNFKGYAYKLYRYFDQDYDADNNEKNNNKNNNNSINIGNVNDNSSSNKTDDDLEDTRSLVSQGWVTGTKLDLTSLIPFMNYSVQVWFANHKFNGPKSSLEFMTPEDVPPSPRNIQLLSKTHVSVLIGWDKPRPTHGILTEYDIRVIAKAPLLLQPPSSSSSSSTEKQYEKMLKLPANARTHNITLLKPYTNYIIQVRASTYEGYGAWGEGLDVWTEESVPSEPQYLRNTSRSPHNITLQWQPPLNENGVILNYKVICNSVSKSKAQPIERVLNPPQTNVTVDELQPGINYDCKVAAATKIGRGKFAELLLWTEPKISFDMPAPRLKQSLKRDNMIIVELDPMTSIDSMEEADILNRVVVEVYNPKLYLSSGNNDGKKKRNVQPMQSSQPSSSLSSPLVSSSTPCELSYNDLVDYYTAFNRGLNCYIAAEIPRVYQARTFVVGDNKTYGGYYNAKLDPMFEHEVWFGLVVTVDGMTVSSYSKTEQFRRIHHIHQSGRYNNHNNNHEHVGDDGCCGNGGDGRYESSSSLSPSSSTITAVVIGVCLAVALLVILMALVVYNWKLFRARKKAKNYMAGGSGFADDVSDYSDVELNKILLSDPSELKDIPSKQHPPIPVPDLWNYVVPRKQRGDDKIRAEFADLKQNLIFKANVARKHENRNKNRYCNIVAYDHSRVVLKCLPNDPHSDYINANYIHGYNKPKAFIASQGPTKSTMHDMWRMVWQLNTRIIIMVTNLIEGGRPKCDQYWSDTGVQRYGDLVVQMQHLDEYADYKIRSFNVTKNSESRQIYHLHFTTWPDHGVPAHPTSLLEFRKRVKNIESKNNQLYVNSEFLLSNNNSGSSNNSGNNGNTLQQKLLGNPQEKITNSNDNIGDGGGDNSNIVTENPLLVHCSAGVGRTGTYIALDSLLDQAEHENVVDVFGFVNSMRNQRVNMVQTVEQYIFVYDALLEALQNGSTLINCSEFRRRYAELKEVHPATNVSYLQEEFESLQSKNVLYTQDADNQLCDGRLEGNSKKNRDGGIIPSDRCRPHIHLNMEGNNDYINAVFVDGYKQRDAFIVTQTPLPNTIVDFWTMIYQYNCGAIICLEDPDDDGDDDEVIIPYCPNIKHDDDEEDDDDDDHPAPPTTQPPTTTSTTQPPTTTQTTTTTMKASGTFRAGPFHVQTISQDSSSSHHFHQQEFILSCDSSVSSSQKEIIVKRFTMKNWHKTSNNKNKSITINNNNKTTIINNNNNNNNNTNNSNTTKNNTGADNDPLPNRSSLLTLLGSLEKWQQKTGNNTVVVHCRNGANYSGIFCAASYLVERLKIEHEVDVYLGVRHIRVNRHQFISSLVQYEYLYKLIIDYLDSFDTYANFESSI